MISTKQTGYPSIDKPWLKYYISDREDFVHENMYECLTRSNSKKINCTKVFWERNYI